MGKKYTLLLYYEILRKHSDPEHPLSEARIMELMDREGVTVNRNNVERNMGFLMEAGVDVEHARGLKGGYYLTERKFTEAELRLLIDSVLASRHISNTNSKKLIGKIEDLASDSFRHQMTHVKMVDAFEKTENEELFKSIGIIDRAISKKKAIHFDYMKYGSDKKMFCSSSPTVTVLQMILQNQRYYLVSYNMDVKEVRHYRVDRIKNAELTDLAAVPIRDVPGYESGFDYTKYATQLPYMYTDRPEQITFLADESIIDQVVDWLGKKNVIFDKNAPEGKIRVRVTASRMAFKFWALQYLEHVEVLMPRQLRTDILKSLQDGVNKYSKE